MDIHGLRTLNLVATVIFVIFSFLIPIILLIVFGFAFLLSPVTGYFIICIAILLVYIVLIGFFAHLLYQNAVLGLDRGDFEKAKKWTLYGMIVGFFFGGTWITLIIFLISYVSFDEAIWPKTYYYPPPTYPHQAPQYAGYPYPPQQPLPTYPCTTCGGQLRYINQYQRWYCDSCKKYA